MFDKILVSPTELFFRLVLLCSWEHHLQSLPASQASAPATWKWKWIYRRASLPSSSNLLVSFWCVRRWDYEKSWRLKQTKLVVEKNESFMFSKTSAFWKNNHFVIWVLIPLSTSMLFWVVFLFEHVVTNYRQPTKHLIPKSWNAARN